MDARRDSELVLVRGGWRISVLQIYGRTDDGVVADGTIEAGERGGVAVGAGEVEGLEVRTNVIAGRCVCGREEGVEEGVVLGGCGDEGGCQEESLVGAETGEYLH